MKKQVRNINLRPIGCGIISRCLDETPEDADKIVAEQIVRVLTAKGLVAAGETTAAAKPDCGYRLPVRTTREIQADAMTPRAVAVKHLTPGMRE